MKLKEMDHDVRALGCEVGRNMLGQAGNITEYTNILFFKYCNLFEMVV